VIQLSFNEAEETNSYLFTAASTARCLVIGAFSLAALARVAGAILAGTYVLLRVALARLRAAAVGVRSAALAIAWHFHEWVT